MLERAFRVECMIDEFYLTFNYALSRCIIVWRWLYRIGVKYKSMLMAIRRASSAVSTFACSASVALSRETDARRLA